MIREVTLANVGEMSGGAVAAQFQRHLARAIADCEDRPKDQTSRKVTLSLEVVPVLDSMEGSNTPNASTANITCRIKSSLPDHVSRPTECHLKQGQKAVFNDMSEANVQQRTIDELTPDS